MINTISPIYTRTIASKKTVEKENQQNIIDNKTIKNLNIAIPGFNDHNVILFAGAPKTTYQPVDAIEKNSIELYKSVSPSVVMIKSTKGEGSGSIIDKEGHIITNYHVAKNNSSNEDLKVILKEGQVVDAKVIGADKETDIALLKIDIPEDYLNKRPAFKIGSSENLEVGQRVYAIGNPYGFFRSMSQGIISATNRTMKAPTNSERLIKGFIQTDAPLSPGNSGGPLVNARGEQIGMITSKLVEGKGPGFALPMDTVMKMAEVLKTKGKADKPYLGISGGIPLEYLPSKLKAMMRLKPEQKGVMVQNVIAGSPAEKAWIEPAKLSVNLGNGEKIKIGGDIITKIDNRPVSNMTEIFEVLDSKEIGEKIGIEVINVQVEPLPNGGYAFIPMEPQVKNMIVEQEQE